MTMVTAVVTAVPAGIPAEATAVALIGEPCECVYFLCKNGKCIYVGQTANLAARLKAHSKTRSFDAAYFIPASAETRLEVESMWIQKLKPPENKKPGRPAKFLDGQYVTFRMPAALVQAIDEECAATRATRSDVVVHRLRQSFGLEV